jgi:DNA-binding response OmpR family regulator
MAKIEINNFKIFVADENITFRNTMASTLRLQGFNVEFVDGGFHLIHLIERFDNCHLIIIHENMFDMSALEIISLIRTVKSKIELPILFISKNSDDQSTYDMILSGANEYVLKSANFTPIINRVHKYFKILENS